MAAVYVTTTSHREKMHRKFSKFRITLTLSVEIYNSMYISSSALLKVVSICTDSPSPRSSIIPIFEVRLYRGYV